MQHNDEQLTLKTTHATFYPQRNPHAPPIRLHGNLGVLLKSHTLEMHDLIADSAALHLQGDLALDDWQTPIETWHGHFNIPKSNAASFIDGQHLIRWLTLNETLSNVKGKLSFTPNQIKFDGTIDQSPATIDVNFATHSANLTSTRMNATTMTLNPIPAQANLPLPHCHGWSLKWHGQSDASQRPMARPQWHALSTERSLHCAWGQHALAKCHHSCRRSVHAR